MFKIIMLNIITLAFIFAYQNSYAQQYTGKLAIIDADSGYDEIIMPKFFSTSVLIDDDDIATASPAIFEVQFLRMPPLTGYQERVDRLIQGVTEDLPPEYDHYGYEIRRYMAKSLDVKVFEDNDFLIEQIKNTRKAKVISKFWQKHLESEVDIIEEIIDKEAAVPFSVRTAFKQNRVIVRTFFISLNNWIEANENVLTQVLKQPSLYELLYPEIIIIDSFERREFYNFYLVKQTKLTDIKEYLPFALMVH